MKKLIGIRVNEMTLQQIAGLKRATGMNTTEIISLALDRLAQSKLVKEIEMEHINYVIIVGQDKDAFLGDNTGENLNLPASQKKYETAIRKVVNEIYPNLVLEFAWDGKSDYAHLMDEVKGYEHLQDDLEEIFDRVYNRQDFWVYTE